MKSRMHLLLLGCTLLSPLEAQALSLTQGKWQFVYESTSPFSPQPQKNTDVQCVTATDWDPAQSVAGSGHCKITNVTHDSRAFKGTVSCSRGTRQSTHDRHDGVHFKRYRHDRTDCF